MFNTMTITKLAGALIGAALFLLLLLWAASSLFNIAPAVHGEGEHPAQAYTIETATAAPAADAAAAPAADAAAAPAAEGAAPAAAPAAGDAAAGEKVFAKCKACHAVDGKDKVGPHLNGVVGRAMASAPGFGYSDAMKGHAAEAPNWTPEALAAFLADPKGVVPGTKMSFAGLKKPEDVANVIAYLAAHP